MIWVIGGRVPMVGVTAECDRMRAPGTQGAVAHKWGCIGTAFESPTKNGVTP